MKCIWSFSASIVLLASFASGTPPKYKNCGYQNQRPATAEIEIISYNDVYEMKQDDMGNGLKLGGPSRVVPMVHRLRQVYENSLVIFAGDTMSPSLWSSEFKGMQMIDAHNALQVDFACLGNHEFDFGIEGFLNVSAKSNFPWLNANAYEIATDKLLRNTQPNIVKKFSSPTMGEIVIGAFGVMYDMKDSSKGMKWIDPIEAAKEQVRILRKEKKVDFVIALTHQDWKDDNRFSQEVAGVDLIYGGHDHTAMMQTTFGAPYLKSDLDFRNVWFSHVKYYAPIPSNGTNSSKPTKSYSTMTHKNVPITEGLPTDKGLDEVIEKYSAQIQVLHKRIVGELCSDYDLRTTAVRVHETPIGNFYADAFLPYYKGHIVTASIMNGGGIRTDRVWPKGKLSLGDVISWSPFGNTLFLVEMSGANLRTFINYKMVDSCGDGMAALNGLYYHVGGIKYEFKCSGAGQGKVTTLTYNSATKKSEIGDNDSVVVAMPDFMYTSMFLNSGAAGKLVLGDKEADRIDKVLETYLQSLPNQSICNQVEGRTKVIF